MSDDLGQIQQDIGKLLQSADNARNQRDTIFLKLDEYGKELVSLRQEHNVLSRDMEQTIKPEIAIFQKMRNRGIGIAAGLVLATGSVSAWLTKTFSNLWPSH